MAYTPYDWIQNQQNRRDYLQDQVREGSPVVGLSYGGGVLLLTLRRTQDKIFEIYDRLIFSGVGHQADLETLRLAAIDFAHREGFSLSPEDVTAQRVVGVALSPLIKRGFGDFFAHPLIAKSLFAELGATPAEDVFYTLDFDGEFSLLHQFTALAGGKQAEEDMLGYLETAYGEKELNLSNALKLALATWPRGRYHSLMKEETIAEEELPVVNYTDVLRNELQHGAIEAAALERIATRESKFRHLREDEVAPILEEFLSGST